MMILIFFSNASVYSDQPIMNMMPRWDGGYGFQLKHEIIMRDDLLQGSQVVARGFNETIHQLHIEGVYTWNRSIRLTAKLPVVLDARREVLVSGEKHVERTRRLGDLTLALPLKQYFNFDGRSGSWTFAPQLRIPTLGRKTSYDIYDREWGVGLSLGYETETAHLFFAIGLSGFVFEDEDPNESSVHIDLGWNFRDNAQLLLETDVKREDDGSQVLSSGPALYWRFTDVLHFRFEWKHDINSRVGRNEFDHAYGDTVSIGLGFVW